MKKSSPETYSPIDEEKYLAAKAEEAAQAAEAEKERARIIMEGLKPLRDVEVEPVVENGHPIDVNGDSSETSVNVRAGEWVNTDRPTLPARNEFIDD